MPRTLLPFAVDDISALAKSLRTQLSARTEPPGHVEMLNMLARAAGRRNFQQFRAQTAADPAPPTPDPEPDRALVERTARHFDAEGRLATWPAKTSQQSLALWGLWSRIPPETVFSEVGFNQQLNTLSQIGDPALLRRSMVHADLVSRTDDCRDYRRIERRPPPDALALIRRLGPGPD